VGQQLADQEQAHEPPRAKPNPSKAKVKFELRWVIFLPKLCINLQVFEIHHENKSALVTLVLLRNLQNSGKKEID